MIKAELKGSENINLSKYIDSEIKGILSNSNLKLEIGFFETAKYENGTYVAEVAKFQEFGTLKIPSRPFFRTAISSNQSKWVGFLKQNLVSTKNLELSLNRVGELGRGDIVASIMKTNTPPNAEVTIKQKGSSKPLVDTGLMRSSVNFKVVER